MSPQIFIYLLTYLLRAYTRCDFVLVVHGSIKCSVCDSSDISSDCLINPPAPQLCEGFEYCIAIAKYHQNGRYSLYVLLIYIVQRVVLSSKRVINYQIVRFKTDLVLAQV